MESKYIAGYTGYVPGEKWKFGSRSGSEPPPLSRLTVQQQNIEPQARPVSRKMSRSAKMRAFESDVIRGADSSTQFPVQTTEMATQADTENNFEENYNAIQNNLEGRRSRPTTRNGRPPLDGRNGRNTLDGNRAAHVLFMPEDPFKGLNSNYNAGKRNGRYYDPYQENAALSKSMSGSIPAAGYSGHIPGMNNASAVGKSYGVVIRELKGQSS